MGVSDAHVILSSFDVARPTCTLEKQTFGRVVILAWLEEHTGALFLLFGVDSVFLPACATFLL